MPPLRTPLLVVGTVTDPVFTGWSFDHCKDSRPVLSKDRYADDECFYFGGDIFAATLVAPRIPGGPRIARSMKIGFTGHAWAREYSARHYLLLQPASDEFRAATGIEYVAPTFDDYDSANRCLKENGLGHADRRLCPEPQFHRHKSGQCVPIGEYLEHYAQ